MGRINYRDKECDQLYSNIIITMQQTNTRDALTIQEEKIQQKPNGTDINALFYSYYC